MNGKSLALLIAVLLMFGFGAYRFLADTRDDGPVPQQSAQPQDL